jgi:hypothetical protein
MKRGLELSAMQKKPP